MRINRLKLHWGIPAIIAAAALAHGAEGRPDAAARPNILWLVADDISPHLGCYGETAIKTPNLDRFAAAGARFDRAFVTSPICSPSRSALITGRYQTGIGAQNHRSGHGTEKNHLPAGVELVPALFRRAGYYTSNGDGEAAGKKPGKTDYNFEWDASVYDGSDWSGRRPGQPFFAQIQLFGGKFRDMGWWHGDRGRALLPDRTPPDKVSLPPYYPATPELQRDWADTLDAIRLTDRQIGDIIARLKQESLLENTVIFFLSDHGVSHARGKQFLYNEGTHIPLLVRGPGILPGSVRQDLVEHIDVAATSLALAGLALPEGMDGRDLFARDFQPRDAVFGARDRADETVDCIRSVRTEHWKYIRNFYPQRPYLSPNAYKDNKPCVMALRALHAAHRLNKTHELLFAPTRPAEELYDLLRDPWEIHNLADVPAEAPTLREMRSRLAVWMKQTGDPAPTPEPERLYDSDMAAYLRAAERIPGRRAQIEANIRLMKQWAAQGK